MNHQVEATIRGLSPLLMHRYVGDGATDTHRLPIEEQAERGAYRDSEGFLFIPSTWLYQSMVNAGRYSKGKRGSSLMHAAAGSIMVTPEEIPLGTKSYEIDSRSAVNKQMRQASRIMVYRPRLDDWSIVFTVLYDSEVLTHEQVRKILDDAGSRVGIGSFRPANKGPFGRFQVTGWERGPNGNGVE